MSRTRAPAAAKSWATPWPMSPLPMTATVPSRSGVAMPSRPIVVLILLFWLVVLGMVVYREVVPRFFGSEPPTPEFVATDELSQATVSWSVYRGPADADEKIGKMSSRIEYVAMATYSGNVESPRVAVLGLRKRLK